LEAVSIPAAIGAPQQVDRWQARQHRDEEHGMD